MHHLPFDGDDFASCPPVADLSRIPDEAWQRVGVHSEVGLVTVRQLLLHAIRHLESHAAAIDDKRAAMGIAR